MNRDIKEGVRLLKKKQYRELSYRVLEKIPYFLFRYDNFYIVYCKEIRNQRLFRPLRNNYMICYEKFNYALLERIKREIPNDLGTVYYRATDREFKTYIIYIEHFGKIVSATYVLFDQSYISPSGFELKMNSSVAQLYGGYIAPGYRLRGLHMNMVKAAYDLSRYLGQPGLYGEIRYTNRHSFFSYNKLGFDVYKNIKYVQIFGKKHFFEGKAVNWLASEKITRSAF